MKKISDKCVICQAHPRQWNIPPCRTQTRHPTCTPKNISLEGLTERYNYKQIKSLHISGKFVKENLNENLLFNSLISLWNKQRIYLKTTLHKNFKYCHKRKNWYKSSQNGQQQSPFLSFWLLRNFHSPNAKKQGNNKKSKVQIIRWNKQMMKP